MNEDDPIVQELDVFLSHTLEENLFLCQFPTRPSWRPISLDQINAGRYRPQQGSIEFEVDHCFPDHAKDELGHNPKGVSTFSSLGVPLKTNMTVGVIRGDQVFLTPLQHVFQLRPRFKNLQDHQEEQVVSEEVEQMANDESDHESTSLLHQKMKKAAANKGPAVVVRQSYYSKYKAKKALEPWLPLTVLKSDNDIANQMRNALCQTTNNPVPSISNNNQFLSELFPNSSFVAQDVLVLDEVAPSAAVLEKDTTRRSDPNDAPVIVALKGFLVRELGIYGVLNIHSIIKLILNNNKNLPEPEHLPHDSATIGLVLGQIADSIGECWFLKTDTSLEPWRKILINLFRDRGVPIQKSDLVQACRHENVTDFTPKVYSMLMSQLAEKPKGSHSKWKLKSGNI
ncbi:hypothetical protein GEMRC1_013431 [Eukaryota sp. GEM-RC1]